MLPTIDEMTDYHLKYSQFYREFLGFWNSADSFDDNFNDTWRFPERFDSRTSITFQDIPVIWKVWD